MPSPGKSVLKLASPRWRVAVIGALVLAMGTYTVSQLLPDAELSAEELPEGKDQLAPQSGQLATADLENSPSQDVALTPPVAASPKASTRATPATYSDHGAVIPAVDLTAEALTRYLQDRRSYEIRDYYPVTATPNGPTADQNSIPATASPSR